MRITVVGGGRMGLPLACTFARHGADVTVADVDPGLVERLEAGRCPYAEPGLDDLVAELHAAGRLHATRDTTAACARSDAVVIIVPARLTPQRDIDLGVLEEASAAVGQGLRAGTLVVYETTVSVGATRKRLVPVLERCSGLEAGTDLFVAYSPERVKANHVLARLGDTPKVVGGLDEPSLRKAVDLYTRYLGAPVEASASLEAAEMTKLLGMLYRDVNIALANEMAAFCELAQVDFEAVRRAANGDGEAHVLAAGIGVGGHCTPVYPYFLTRESRRLGLPQRLSEAAREINDLQPERQLRRLEAGWRRLANARVHLLGLGFRPGVKVDTLSPAYALRDLLFERGASVTLSDPYYSPAEVRRAGFEAGEPEQAQAVILNTAHPGYASIDFAAWRQAGVEAVIDGRNTWDPRAARAAGLAYFGVGKPFEPPA